MLRVVACRKDGISTAFCARFQPYLERYGLLERHISRDEAKGVSDECSLHKVRIYTQLFVMYKLFSRDKQVSTESVFCTLRIRETYHEILEVIKAELDFICEEFVFAKQLPWPPRCDYSSCPATQRGQISIFSFEKSGFAPACKIPWQKRMSSCQLVVNFCICL